MKDAGFKNKYDVAVVGGGASGMVAACFCAASGKKVCILEKNKKLGRKLSVTGNGKCNLTNYSMGEEHYASSCDTEKSTFVENILADYGTVDILEWFGKIGILCKDKNGYLYPVSEQAQSVTGALEAELKRLNVDVFLEKDVREINKSAYGCFVIESDDSFFADKLILSCGGPAAPVYGASRFGFDYLKKTGHTVSEPLPALCPVAVSDKIIKSLAGVRLEAEIEIILGNEKHWEKGEIIFNADNVSGIPVFQLSRYVSKYFDRFAVGKNGQKSGSQGNNNVNRAALKIDLIPSFTQNELVDFCMQLSERNPKLTVEYLFRGILNYKAVYYVLKENGFDPEQCVSGLNRKSFERMVSCLKNFNLSVTGTKGFENAQVCTGGLSTDDINWNTLESKLVKGLYVTGELLDVDGNCGGYNLHFAFATGMRSGKAAAYDQN